ncbi:hypothetical protein JW823_09155 [bacterium]|nr:hypothetical protein [candidate division CSSED10-310 bacterium]
MKYCLAQTTRTIAKWIECLLAFGILIGIVIFLVTSIIRLTGMDWLETFAFYEMINRILLIMIGVELIRTLITHDLETIVELLAIVIARKLLKPDLANFDIIFSVLSFAALLAARKYLLDIAPAQDLDS